jgi:hypothetical protein
MLWLVETQFASAWKRNPGNRTPAFFVHFRATDALYPKRRYLVPQIVTHEGEFMLPFFFGRMNCHFSRRQSENQPSVAGVHGFESEDVTEKCAISSRILAEYDYVGSKDHDLCSLLNSRILERFSSSREVLKSVKCGFYFHPSDEDLSPGTPVEEKATWQWCFPSAPTGEPLYPLPPVCPTTDSY